MPTQATKYDTNLNQTRNSSFNIKFKVQKKRDKIKIREIENVNKSR